MKIAACFSGQLGTFQRCFHNQKEVFIDENSCDVFVHTSDAISQKINCVPNPNWSKYMGEHREYLKNNGEDNWRKNYGTYGIIYNIPHEVAMQSIRGVYGDRLKAYYVERESISEIDKELEITKWEWLKNKQFDKMLKCNQLLHMYESMKDVKYDIVIRSRFDIVFTRKINVKQIISKYDNIDNKIFVFGGWESPEKDRFMDGYICDGFVFGKPDVIDKYCDIYNRKTPYPPNPKYIDYYHRMGDNAEYQVKQHMLKNNIEICYINDPQYQLSDNRCGRWQYQVIR